jgi:hypothetical protein
VQSVAAVNWQVLFTHLAVALGKVQAAPHWPQLSGSDVTSKPSSI